MKNKHKIYIVGKMKNHDVSDRCEMYTYLKEKLNDVQADVDIIFPYMYYNYDTDLHKSEREVMEWELTQVSTSDIMIVDLDGIDESVGSHFEIATAVTINNSTDRHIFVLSYGDIENIHPWISNSIFRNEKCYKDLIDYLVNYMLV